MAENITPRIILSADSFESDVALCDLLANQQAAAYVKGVKFSQHLLGDHHASEHVLRVCAASSSLEVFADAQLAGGYDDIVSQLQYTRRIHRPSAVTVAAGTPPDAIRYVQQRLSHEDHLPDIFLTGALPEMAVAGIARIYNRTPEEFTTKQAEAAQELGIRGVYAAAAYARHFDGIEYIGAGISDEAENYLTKKGVNKVATTAASAVLKGCDIIIVGHTVADAENPEEALIAMGERISRVEAGGQA